MEHQTKVKLFVEDAPTEWVVCAVVSLYDRDRVSRDDPLGTNVTDVYGEATFRFVRDDFLDVDDHLGGALPELYVKVYDSEGRCALSTRVEAAPNHVPELIRIPVDRALARHYGLI